MMGWLLLPTDNLHKFCAVLGLILIFGPLASLFYLVHYTGELTRIASLGIAKTEIETGYLERSGEVIKVQMRNLLKQEGLAAFQSVESLTKRLEAHNEQLKVIRLSAAENKAATATALQFIKYSDRAFFFVFLSNIIGVQLAVFGFKGWAETLRT